MWSLSPLPTVYTLGHYEEILVRSPQFIANTLRYAGLAALIDVALGAVIAWLLVRGRVAGRRWLDTLATIPLAIPGVVIAIGFLRAFGGFVVPGLGDPLTSTWLVLVIVYAVAACPTRCAGPTPRSSSCPPRSRRRPRTWGRAARGLSGGLRCR